MLAGCLLNFLPPLDSDEIFLGSGFYINTSTTTTATTTTSTTTSTSV